MTGLVCLVVGYGIGIVCGVLLMSICQGLHACKALERHAAEAVRELAGDQGGPDRIESVVLPERLTVRETEAAVSRDWYQDVCDFKRKFGQEVGERPSLPSQALQDLSRTLIEEEASEAARAIESQDLVELADALADTIYVCLFAAVSYGIDLRPVWDEVHASNMAKEGGGSRSDGKILKPPGWKPPDVAGILARQGR